MNKLIDKSEKIVSWPKQAYNKQALIKWLSTKFELKIKYSEKDINKIIEMHHSFNDIALLRRELVSRSFLSRKNDGSIYWKNY